MIKVFLKNLWKYDLKWDECLPESLCQEWNKIIKILKHIVVIKIPCFIGTHEQDPVYEVLIFCDASIKSYAADVAIFTCYKSTRYPHYVSEHDVFKMCLTPITFGKGQKKKEMEG